MKITFKKLSLGSILDESFNDLQSNNVLDFERNRICVIYGPNGTGKTTLASILSGRSENAGFQLEIDSTPYSSDQDTPFHIIEDQNGRNIIAGSTEEFILGDNIQREYELKKQLEEGFETLFKSTLVNGLKSIFGIAKRNTHFDGLISNPSIKQYTSDIANNKSKGKGIDREEFIQTIEAISIAVVNEDDLPNFSDFIEDYKADNSVIREFLDLQIDSIRADSNYSKIIKTTEAVRILEQFPDTEDCVVCDREIDSDELLVRKKTQYQDAVDCLNTQTKEMIAKFINVIDHDDVFEIKKYLKEAIATGSTANLGVVKTRLEKYKHAFNSKLCNFFVSSLSESRMAAVHSEYKKITLDQPEFEGEDIVFIETFLNDCLERKIKLERDSGNTLHLLLGESEFLNTPRTELSLSNGEQNFLSLAFELLKAKKLPHEVIILDDPISSFDSIFKNKIAYAILKILEGKKSIVLTHNTDLIKLLEHQHQKSFNLYQLTNKNGGENGFLPISREEVKILLYIHEFIGLLRDEIAAEIVNERNFLISIVPFMRGYCQIVADNESKNKLTKLMHGYETEPVNVSEIYSTLFSNSVIQSRHVFSAADIMATDLSTLQILRSEKFPLLNRTLEHTLSYLFLRLHVEKKLSVRFSVNTADNDMLSKIILKAFTGQSKEAVEQRVFFLSRKTLLNEFNHFEIDMNIFQPAFDITNQTLLRERTEIMNRLTTICHPTAPD
jgi:ABC-type lipoprotein export system ATPase subunit